MTKRIVFQLTMAIAVVLGIGSLLLWPFAALAQVPDPAATPPDLATLVKQVLEVVGDFRTGAVLAALLAAVNLLTNLTKVPWLADHVPAKARPWIALGLGALTATFTAKVAGASWLNAIVAGTIAGLGSIGFHELVNTFQTKPQAAAGQVLVAAVNGDAAATAQVKALSDQLDDIQRLPEAERGAALADWAARHPPGGA